MRSVALDCFIIGLTVGLMTVLAVALKPPAQFLGSAGVTVLLSAMLLRKLHEDERAEAAAYDFFDPDLPSA
jgi:hypothetical protein